MLHSIPLKTSCVLIKMWKSCRKSLVLIFIISYLGAFVEGQCTGETDLIIAFPGTSSVSDFDVFEGIITYLLKHFVISDNDFNIGLVLYGEYAIPFLYPTPYLSRLQVSTRISLMRQLRSTQVQSLGLVNNPAVALNMIYQMFITGDPVAGPAFRRSNARKLALLITHGSTPDVNVQSVIDAAENLKTVAVVYATAALLTGSLNDDFRRIGSDSCRLFIMDSYLHRFHRYVSSMASGICSEVDPNVTVTKYNCFPRDYGYDIIPRVTCRTPNYRFQANPDSCVYYYECASNVSRPNHKTCRPNTLWDPRINACNHLTSSSCYDPFLTCPFAVQALYPYPPDCTKYINCNIQGTPYLQSCPAGYHFNRFGTYCSVGRCV